MIVLCWTFMGNHIHLLFQFSEKVNCGTLVGTLESCLTKAFNRLHNRKGPLWRGRYKDVTISEPSHLWSSLFYILLNKHKAGLIKSFDHDIYSSANVYLRGLVDDITTLPIDYLELGDTPLERQRAFRSMLTEAWRTYKDKRTWQRIAQGETVTACDGRIDMGQVLAMFDRQEAILSRAMAIATKIGLFSEAALEAMERARYRINHERARLSEYLHCRKIPRWVLDHFFAEEDFICDFVSLHRSQFRYSKSPPHPSICI